MDSHNSDGSRAATARAGFLALCATLAMGLGLMASPAEAAPFAYVANLFSNTVSVVDTASNTVMATVGVGTNPIGVAITPDGKHAYVANINSSDVSVIDTATNTVPLGPAGTVPVGAGPFGVAVTPDGKHVYVTNIRSNNVSVIDTATNTVPVGPAGTVPVGIGPEGVAVTPDGKLAYVTNSSSNTVSVIDTATNTEVAITPDGKHAYVANDCSNNVSVIDTATNTVGITVGVGTSPAWVAIMPPPVGVPFLAFNAKLEIDLDRKPKEDRFELESSFTLSSATPGIYPVTDPVMLQVGAFTTTIPAGSFKKHRDGDGAGDEHEHEHEDEDGFFNFHGVIDGVRLEALIKRTGTLRYAFDVEAKGANLAGTKNPVQVMLTIGNNSGTTSAKARISPSGEEAQRRLKPRASGRDPAQLDRITL